MARKPQKPVAGKATPKKAAVARRPADPPRLKTGARTIPVHALADERVHLAAAQLGRLKQGYLKTLCGLQAVSALSPFVLAEKGRKKCPTCFGRVDDDGLVK